MRSFPDFETSFLKSNDNDPKIKFPYYEIAIIRSKLTRALKIFGMKIGLFVGYYRDRNRVDQSLLSLL
ncbi:hypothetical protein [Leptospira santarosai]|uniref:hypothetical protein n=1 Tax=Leptospira santarosai TaxID=28183 RepID=UPI00062836AC